MSAMPGMWVQSAVCADVASVVCVLQLSIYHYCRFWRQSPNWATMIASVDRPFGDSRRIRQQSPFLATVAVFGDKLSPKTATIVSSVDRPLDWQCSL